MEKEDVACCLAGGFSRHGSGVRWWDNSSLTRAEQASNGPRADSDDSLDCQKLPSVSSSKPLGRILWADVGQDAPEEAKKQNLGVPVESMY